MFTTHLTDVEIQELTQAAIDGDVFQFDRRLWFTSVRRAFVLMLQIANSPLAQFQLDLAKLNTVERLEDGSVPLHQFLTNIERLLRTVGVKEAAIFARLANKVGNAAQGVTPVANVASLPEVVKQEAIVHEDDSVPFGFLAAALKVGRSVGRIVVPRFENGQQRMLAGGRPWLMNGTGWLIGGDLLVTNHHVINARNAGEAAASDADLVRQAAGATVNFDFDADDSAPVNVTVSKVELSDPVLDYAVLRLSEKPADRGPLRLSPQLLTMTASTFVPVNIIQHPRGLPKRIAFRNNLLSGADGDTIRYFTDTDFGSSGSPVCDDSWRVVALHRGAQQVQNVNFQGKDTAFVNFGTQVPRMLADVKQRAATVHGEILASQ
jgi:endonuclease G